MSVIRTPSRMASFTTIELSSGNPESKRDMKGTKGKLTTRTIIIVPIAFLSKHEPAAIRQRSTKRMCHDGEAS